jgi:hypothetical protein
MWFREGYRLQSWRHGPITATRTNPAGAAGRARALSLQQAREVVHELLREEERGGRNHLIALSSGI